MKLMKISTLIKRFAPYYKKYMPILLIDLFCASLTTIAELMLPIISYYLTDLAINNIAAMTIKTIISVGIFYLSLRIIDCFASYYMQYTGHVMGAKIETDMRKELFQHLQNQSYTFYNNTKIGQIMARLTSDLFDITEFSHHCPEEYFIAILKITVAFIVLANQNLWLTLIVFSIIPLMIFCSIKFQKRMRKAFKETRDQLGEINAQVEDSLLGIKVVKSFANEDIENKKFNVGNVKFLDIKKVKYKAAAGFQVTTRIFDGLMYLIVIVAGAYFMMKKYITPPEFTAYLLYVTTLVTSIRKIVDFTEQFQKGMTGIERFLELIDAKPDITDIDNAVELKQVNGDIEFRNVSFTYTDDNTEVLDNINLSIKKGTNVAIVGPSGSGKSTLCNLIPRFYDVTKGEILIDGEDIKQFTLHSLRSNVGVVQQDIYLFSGTVYENIAYGKPDATKEEVIRAAKEAGAHEFIMSLINGYDTYVGERGVKLSGGQKQRISIARVFLKNPPILILDEATSALDNESERLVQESLETLTEGRTTFTIAHRLTTIRHADLILVLTEKGIEESGTHDELMDKDGIYSGLYKMYSGT